MNKMLGRVSDEVMEAAIVIVAILTVLVLIYYSAIALNPRMTLNPFPPPAPSPLVLAVPTFPPTWTPVPTTTPTPTTLPTLTPTATPLPLPTATSMPRPMLPTATPTPAPTLTPSVVYQYQPGTGHGDSAKLCFSSAVYGYVYDAGGQPISGVRVKLYNLAGYTAFSLSKEADHGYYDFILGDESSVFYVVVVDGAGQPLSPTVRVVYQGKTFEGTDACWYRLDWRRSF